MRTISEALLTNDVSYVCHLTPCEQLPSIFRHGGLLSLIERRRRGIAEPSAQHYWGDDAKREQLADFVVCSFRPSWGMVRRHTHDLAIVVLDAALVCCTPKTCFLTTNSARASVTAQWVRQQTGVYSLLGCLAGWPTDDAEILVPSRVGVSSFRGLVFSYGALSRWWPLVRDEIARSTSNGALSPSFKTFENRGLGMAFPLDFPPAEGIPLP